MIDKSALFWIIPFFTIFGSIIGYTICAIMTISKDVDEWEEKNKEKSKR